MHIGEEPMGVNAAGDETNPCRQEKKKKKLDTGMHAGVRESPDANVWSTSSAAEAQVEVA